MTNAKTIGTCPACFRPIALTAAGVIARHGWLENGGRKAGSYGNVWHTDGCFGIGYEPFEISAAGTVAFFWERVVPMGRDALAQVARLRTRPDLIIERRSVVADGPHRYGVRTEYPMFSVRLRDGDAFEIVEHALHFPGHSFSYAFEHETRVRAAVEFREDMITDGFRLCDAVANWKPGKLAAPKAKSVKLVHCRSSKNRVRTVCGKSHTSIMGGRTLLPTSTFDSEITCPDCKANA